MVTVLPIRGQKKPKGPRGFFPKVSIHVGFPLQKKSSLLWLHARERGFDHASARWPTFYRPHHCKACRSCIKLQYDNARLRAHSLLCECSDFSERRFVERYRVWWFRRKRTRTGRQLCTVSYDPTSRHRGRKQYMTATQRDSNNMR
jgi:hypothetical protein